MPSVRDHEPELSDVLRTAAEEGRRAAAKGVVADYIPVLADADEDAFALAVSDLQGDDSVEGDADVPFAIQSISKVFALVLAMQRVGGWGHVSERLWSRVGREPSGDPFNSLVQLEFEKGVPRNPFINAGALVVDDVLIEHCPDPKSSMIELLSDLTGEDIGLDQDVLAAEGNTGHRNRAMASLMRSFGNIHSDVDDVLDVYVHQCSVSMTARQLAKAVRFLANDGVDPLTGHEVLPDLLARRVNAIMLTCGTYDAAGEFAFSVGLPCKSGIGGGIIAVVPDRMGVCAWSPPLDDTGNSLGGRVALHELAERLHLSIF